MPEFHSRWLTENQPQTLCYSTDETDKRAFVSNVKPIVERLEPDSDVLHVLERVYVDADEMVGHSLCTVCGEPLVSQSDHELRKHQWCLTEAEYLAHLRRIGAHA